MFVYIHIIVRKPYRAFVSGCVNFVWVDGRGGSVGKAPTCHCNQSYTVPPEQLDWNAIIPPLSFDPVCRGSQCLAGWVCQGSSNFCGANFSPRCLWYSICTFWPFLAVCCWVVLMNPHNTKGTVASVLSRLHLPIFLLVSVELFLWTLLCPYNCFALYILKNLGMSYILKNGSWLEVLGNTIHVAWKYA